MEKAVDFNVRIVPHISRMKNTTKAFCNSGDSKCSCATTGSLNKKNTEKKIFQKSSRQLYKSLPQISGCVCSLRDVWVFITGWKTKEILSIYCLEKHMYVLFSLYEGGRDQYL